MKSPLIFESLESREPLTITLDVNPVETAILEGSTVSLGPAAFVDTTPAGAYSSFVDWGDGSQTTARVVAPGVAVGRVKITIDFRYDSSNFFDTQAKRNLLQSAADRIANRLDDQLLPISPDGNNRFTATLLNPSTGSTESVRNLAIGQNEIVIFAGGDEMDESVLALGGAGGYRVSGSSAFISAVESRGQVGAFSTDVATWGGVVSFNSNIDWHFGATAQGLDRDEFDLLSVASHEIVHVLGFNSEEPAFGRHIVGGKFAGPKATAAYDGSGSPPLNVNDQSHWADGVRDGGVEANMTASLLPGTRNAMTELDWAVLDDIGWEIVSSSTDGSVHAEHIYFDDGAFLANIELADSTDADDATVRFRVENVAPTLRLISLPSVASGVPASLTAEFADPGLGDTHDITIDWGDGTIDVMAIAPESATLNTDFKATHAYDAEGEYRVTVRVTDDDGGSDQQSASLLVQPPLAEPDLDWQNASNPLDVNDDGQISPVDALLIVNELNDRQFSSTTGVLDPITAGQVDRFFDTNGDDFVSAIDALMVVNALNNRMTMQARRIIASAVTLEIELADRLLSSADRISGPEERMSFAEPFSPRLDPTHLRLS